MNIIENKKQKNISDIYDSLSPESKQSVMDFALYLSQRDGVVEAILAEKIDIPRPAKESVVAALKRLNKSYPMIEKNEVFHQSSALMTEHIMQGRDVVEVIDELEVLFETSYQQYLTAFNKDS